MARLSCFTGWCFIGFESTAVFLSTSAAARKRVWNGLTSVITHHTLLFKQSITRCAYVLYCIPYGIQNYCAGTLATPGRVLCRILHGQAVFYWVHCWQYHIDACQVSVRKHRRQHAFRERHEWCEHRGEEVITEQTSGVQVLSLLYSVCWALTANPS